MNWNKNSAGQINEIFSLPFYCPLWVTLVCGHHCPTEWNSSMILSLKWFFLHFEIQAGEHLRNIIKPDTFFFNSVKSTNTSGAPDPPCDVTSQVNYWLGVCGCPEPEARDKDFICAEQEIRAEAQERLCGDSKRWRYNVNDRVLMSTVCIIVAVVYCAEHKHHRYKIWANDHHWRIVKLTLSSKHFLVLVLLCLLLLIISSVAAT